MIENNAAPNAKRAFENVYIDYYNLMCKYIYTKIENKSNVETLVSDIFFKAFTHYDSYDPNLASEKTWLFCIAQNLLKNYYRDKKAVQSIDDITVSDEPIFRDLTEDALYWQEVRDMLADMLLELPERNRRIIVLKYFEGKSAVDIAKILGLTESNVRVIAMRSTKMLKSILTKRGFKWED